MSVCVSLRLDSTRAAKSNFKITINLNIQNESM